MALYDYKRLLDASDPVLAMDELKIDPGQFEENTFSEFIARLKKCRWIDRIYLLYIHDSRYLFEFFVALFDCEIEKIDIIQANLTEINSSDSCIGKLAILAVRSRLKALHWVNSQISVSALKIFTDTLARENGVSLTKLCFMASVFGDAGSSVIADMLRRHSSILHIDLSCCGLTTAGLEEIVKALPGSSLAELYLYGNDFSEGVQPLADALNKSSLESLDLFGCHINEKDILPLIRQLGDNSCLRTLRLARNNFNIFEIFNDCMAGLAKNTVLEELVIEVHNNMITDHELKLFKQVRKNNYLVNIKQLGGGQSADLGFLRQLQKFIDRNKKLQTRERVAYAATAVGFFGVVKKCSNERTEMLAENRVVRCIQDYVVDSSKFFPDAYQKYPGLEETVVKKVFRQ